MANVFLSLPAPPGNGSGAWVNTAAMGAVRDLVVAGGTQGTINIEISNDAVPSKATVVASIVNKGKQQITVAAAWMRATVVGYKAGGAPIIEVGAIDDAVSIAALSVPAGSGTGAGADTSALPIVKTVTVAGPFTGTVLVEYSEDGVHYAPLTVFSNAGHWTGELTAAKMRVTRQGVKAPAGLPLVNIGACASSSGGGGGGGLGNPQIQRYVATGAEGTAFTLPLAVVRASANYSVFPATNGVQSFVEVDTNTPTTTQFNVTVSGALTAGDIIDFLIADR